MFNTFAGIWASRLRANVLLSVQTLMIVSCDTVITLAATVTGSLANRTVEWVQMSGTTVNWLESRYQVSAMFTQSLVRDDKVFRFYIDRGRTTEMYQDVLVTAVPRDTLPDITPVVAVTGLKYVASEMSTGLISIPALSPIGTSSVNNTLRMLTWTNSAEIYFSGASVIKLTSPVTTTALGKVNYISNLPIGPTYRIDSLLDYYGIQRITSSALISTSVINGYVDADASDAVSCTVSVGPFTNSVLEVITRELATIAPIEDTVNPNFTNQAVQLTTLEVITRELTQAPLQSDSMAFLIATDLPVAGSILQVLSVGISTLG